MTSSLSLIDVLAALSITAAEQRSWSPGAWCFGDATDPHQHPRILEIHARLALGIAGLLVAPFSTPSLC
jgi:hypothetical protein